MSDWSSDVCSSDLYLWQSLRGRIPADLPAAWSPGQMPGAQTLLLTSLGLGDSVAQAGFTD